MVKHLDKRGNWLFFLAGLVTNEIKTCNLFTSIQFQSQSLTLIWEPDKHWLMECWTWLCLSKNTIAVKTKNQEDNTLHTIVLAEIEAVADMLKKDIDYSRINPIHYSKCRKNISLDKSRWGVNIHKSLFAGSLNNRMASVYSGMCFRDWLKSITLLCSRINTFDWIQKELICAFYFFAWFIRSFLNAVVFENDLFGSFKLMATHTLQYGMMNLESEINGPIQYYIRVQCVVFDENGTVQSYGTAALLGQHTELKINRNGYWMDGKMFSLRTSQCIHQKHATFTER